MLHIGLYEPEIPPNTGNIMRLCGEHRLRTAPRRNPWDSPSTTGNCAAPASTTATTRRSPCTTAWKHCSRPWRRGAAGTLSTRAYRSYTDAAYRDGDLLLFGPETRGLPQELLDGLGGRQCLRIPMLPDSRSLNLSNAAALVTYEALRQLGFPGLS
jgi:tRNA (cytidine/uridine-2'-O-)-methyltransferase